MQASVLSPVDVIGTARLGALGVCPCAAVLLRVPVLARHLGRLVQTFTASIYTGEETQALMNSYRVVRSSWQWRGVFWADCEGEHVEEAGDGGRVGRFAVGHREDLPVGTGQRDSPDAGVAGSAQREAGQGGDAQPCGDQGLYRDEVVGGERYLRRESGRLALPEQIGAAALAARDPAPIREGGQIRLRRVGELARWRLAVRALAVRARVGGA